MDRLIVSAGDLFLDKGYHQVSLDLIAREAGVAVRTIYLKFGGKEGLFKAVVRAHHDRFIAGMPPPEQEIGTLYDVLFAFAYRYVTFVTSERALALQRLMIAQFSYCHEPGQTFMQQAIDPTLALLEEFFARDNVRGHLRAEFTAAQTARNFLACLLGDHWRHLVSNGMSRSAAALETDVRASVSLFLYGSLGQHQTHPLDVGGE